MGIDDLRKLLGAPAPGVAEWSSVIMRYQKGRAITKNEILDLLKAGHPVPPVLNQMFAEIVKGKFVFTHPRRVPPKRHDPRHDPQLIHDLVRAVEECIKNPEARPADLDAKTREYYDKLAKRLRGGVTPNQSALRHVAEVLGITERKVQKAITDHRKSLQP